MHGGSQEWLLMWCEKFASKASYPSAYSKWAYDERMDSERPPEQPEGAPAGTPSPGPPVHRATELLRELVDATDLFRGSLREDLAVNETDLAAMQHLLTAGPIAPTGLSRLLGISTTATTTAIDRLVELGHVTREPHPSDRRSILVVPSETSRARAFALLMPMLADLERVLAEFSDEEQAAITAYLDRAVAVYRAHAQRGG